MKEKIDYKKKYETLKNFIQTTFVAILVLLTVTIALALFGCSEETVVISGAIAYFWVFIMFKEKIGFG